MGPLDNLEDHIMMTYFPHVSITFSGQFRARALSGIACFYLTKSVVGAPDLKV